jgi:hypothetical protein
MTWIAFADSPRVPCVGFYQLATMRSDGRMDVDPRQFALGPAYVVKATPSYSGFTHFRPWRESVET